MNDLDTRARPVAHGIITVVLAVIALSGAVSSAAALPPDPMRPLEAETCDAAQARLAEARSGSPLVSAQTNAEILLEAEAQVERLCASPAPDPAPFPAQDDAHPSQPLQPSQRPKWPDPDRRAG